MYIVDGVTIRVRFARIDRMSPLMQRRTVDLPDPDGAMSAAAVPLFDVERCTVQHFVRTECPLDILNRHDGVVCWEFMRPI